MADNNGFSIAGQTVRPGERQRVRLPLGKGVSRDEIAVPVEVICGSGAGPRLFVCAALHGDEIGGVEIIRRVLAQKTLGRLRGTLIGIPIVNLYGFVGRTRYLPDRRDLNRAFPGSPRGSLASRLAHLFLTEVVAKATHGIDLHTAAVHRSNLPQVRASLDDEETARLAKAFGVPVLVNANLRDGSLRQAVTELGIPMLLYEGGEALRFDETAIEAGARGVLRVMSALGMLGKSRPGAGRRSFVAESSHWVRAPESGILRARAELGVAVQPGDRLAIIADPLGVEEVPVRSAKAGVVIGRTELPLVNEGEGLFHIAAFDTPTRVASAVATFHKRLNGRFSEEA